MGVLNVKTAPSTWEPISLETPAASPVPVTWTPTITGLTLGSGTRTASYLKTGRTCTLTYHFVFGTGSSLHASSGLTCPLPFTAHNWGANGGGYVYDVSASANWVVGMYLSTKSIVNISTLGYAANESNYQHIHATSPMTWATGDELAFEMTYLTAS